MTDDHGWGRKFLERCDINPDDETDARAAYESCRADHARWLATGEGEMDGGTYWALVDAIKDLYDSERLPSDWPAPGLVRMAQPLRNSLTRPTATETP
jgi:hypothetical protein